MATTTNYSWTTPDDTALVKDGASAIRTLGSSVDTTTKNLNPETTLGDIAYRSSTANVNTRLGLGTAGQVLTVNSGANAPEWATASSGGMTLLSTTSLTGATTTISSISGVYKDLLIIIHGVTNATANGVFRCEPNGTNNITTQICTFGADSLERISASRMVFTASVYDATRTDADNVWAATIFNYANSTNHKAFSINGCYQATVGSAVIGFISSGAIRTNSAISSLVFSSSGGNLSTGTVLIYGVK